MEAGFQFLHKNAICTEQSYAYMAKDGKCHQKTCKIAVPKGALTGFKQVTPKDELALKEAVSKQPVSVAIEADEMAFQLYRGGVLTKKCGVKLDHGVLLVGYGTEHGVEYWKVKNSWGASWGANGYVLIQRGVDKCGIADGPPSYPTGVTAPASYGSAGAGCCGTPCSSNGDCAINLFCCPNHNECMGDDTKSTAGPDCDACGHPSSVVAAFKRCDN